VKRFADPRYWLTLTAVVLGIYLGLEAGAERYIQRQGLRQRTELTELERWKGMIANLAPWAMVTTLAGVTLVWRLCPAPTPGDRAALHRLATAKLAQPLLSEAEQALWIEVSNATEQDHERPLRRTALVVQKTPETLINQGFSPRRRS
jgi:hypothetical protein